MKKASSDLLLLDVNVLIALAWPNHQFHLAATERLNHGKERWATCSLTELGFIRLSSNPRVVGVSRSPMQSGSLLAQMLADDRHVFLAELPSPVSQKLAVQWPSILGHKQVTDCYLLQLARFHGASFLTFDGKLEIFGDDGSLEVLAG